MTLAFAEHQLGIPQAIVLLDLHDDHGHNTAAVERLDVLVAGALLAELLHRGRLNVAGDRISMKLGKPSSHLLRPVEEALGGRATPIVDILQQVVELGLRHGVHSDLVGRGILQVQQRKKWLVFRESVWPTADPAVERALIEHLRANAAVQDTPFCPEDSVFALVGAGGLMASVFEEPVDLAARMARCPIGAVVNGVLNPASGRASFQGNH